MHQIPWVPLTCLPPRSVFTAQIQTSGRRVDVMHYHHAWDGFYGGEWNQARSAYQKIMRDPTAVNLVTVMREPVAHYLSYYYYFLQPQIGVRIEETATKNGNEGCVCVCVFGHECGPPEAHACSLCVKTLLRATHKLESIRTTHER